MSRLRLFFIVIFGLLLVVTTTPATVNAQNALPQIAFVSDRDGNNEIYVMAADGSNQTNLTNNKANDFTPVWPPDGTKILFVSDRDGDKEIYAMAADGSNQTNLTNNKANDFAPSWSPDSVNILFRSSRVGGSQLFVMQTDGSKPQQLTKRQPAAAPVWSPDGKYIAYAILGGRTNLSGSGIAFSGGDAGCYVINADGSNPKQLTQDYVLFTGPIWSPDSKQVGALALQGQEGVGFYLLDIDGQNHRKLDTELVTYNPSWSPNGTQIVFGTSQLILIDVKSGSQKPFSDKKFTLNIVQKAIKALTAEDASLFDIPGIPTAPVWSSDGKQILFTTEDGAKPDIYIINADGTNLVNLSNNPATDTDAVFQPLLVAK